MFFPKLRRRAKWVFLALAIAFAGGFVFFGVGAGGSGIGDYFSDLFNRQPTAGAPDVENAEERVAENPNDPAAHLELARAYQADGQVDAAIGAYERYTSQRPRDTDALRALAALYAQKTAEAQRRAQAASAEAQAASLQQEFAPTDPFAQALAENRINESLSTAAEQRAQAAQQEAQRLARLQTAVYEDLTLLDDDDPLLFLQFAQAAEVAQDYESAVAAYESFLDLAPNDQSAPQVRERIKLLESLTGTTSQ
jgi:tetratricopeptide (TPR) repeat protein